jgi:hypothetical protein
MPRLPSRLAARGRAIPWAMLLQVARAVADRVRRGWEELTPREQAELRRLLRKSKGRRTNLTEREVRDLRRIVTKSVRGAAGLS